MRANADDAFLLCYIRNLHLTLLNRPFNCSFVNRKTTRFSYAQISSRLSLPTHKVSVVQVNDMSDARVYFSVVQVNTFGRVLDYGTWGTEQPLMFCLLDTRFKKNTIL